MKHNFFFILQKYYLHLLDICTYIGLILKTNLVKSVKGVLETKQ